MQVYHWRTATTFGKVVCQILRRRGLCFLRDAVLRLRQQGYPCCLSEFHKEMHLKEEPNIALIHNFCTAFDCTREERLDLAEACIFHEVF